MIILLLGLFLFLTAHSLPFMARGTRARIIDQLGEAPWMRFVSIVNLLGFALICWGYALARQNPVPLYTPAIWTQHLSLLITLPIFPLMFATYLPGRIQSAVGHPTLWAVTIWSLAHLLANGNLADVVLFWSFFIWSVADLISLRYRSAPPVQGAPPGRFNDLIAIALGLLVYLVFLFWAHTWLIGVSPLGVAWQ